MYVRGLGGGGIILSILHTGFCSPNFDQGWGDAPSVSALLLVFSSDYNPGSSCPGEEVERR